MTMKRMTFFLLSLQLVCLLTGCEWIKNDAGDCPTGTWLQLTYTYNLLNVDAAREQVKNVSVFVYDAEGNYVKRLDTNGASLEKNNYRIAIEDLTDGEYDFLVWSGLTDSHFMTNSTTLLESFRLSLSSPSDLLDEDYAPLFYGFLEHVPVDGNYAVHEVSLMKNTNRMACLVTTAAEEPVDAARYTLRLLAENAIMDATNIPIRERTATYGPYSTTTSVIEDPDEEPLPVVKFGLQTLRLQENDNCRLILTDNESGVEVFNLPITRYLCQAGILYPWEGGTLSPQEYLDRQDFHTLIFYLSEDGNRLLQCKINNWILRFNDQIHL